MKLTRIKHNHFMYDRSFFNFRLLENPSNSHCNAESKTSVTYHSCSTEKLTFHQLQLKLESDHHYGSELLQRSLLAAPMKSEFNNSTFKFNQEYNQ